MDLGEQRVKNRAMDLGEQRVKNRAMDLGEQRVKNRAIDLGEQRGRCEPWTLLLCVCVWVQARNCSWPTAVGWGITRGRGIRRQLGRRWGKWAYAYPPSRER